MDPALRLHLEQEELTLTQEDEARRFAEEYIRRQLSTEPVDEQEAEALLCQAYQVAGLAPPARIHWLDGPLPFVAVLALPSVGASVEASVLDSVWASVEDSQWDSVEDCVRDYVEASVEARVEASVGDSVGTSVGDSVWKRVEASVRDSVRASMGASMRASVRASMGASMRDSVRASVWTSVIAYHRASWLAFYRFFDVYLAPNDLHTLARFNQMVSGYWLGQEVAVVVRRPRLLSRDAEGRLHSARGKCLEYRDGWGFYAWHGVEVPEKVILGPETLTRQDFLNEHNVEVRRVMQERMGSRFVPELGGQIIDTNPRGTLYEVHLPADDPERVARYVQVQGASTARQYFLRVPPTIQTAAEAVAWTFQVGVVDYHPAQET